MRNKWDWVGAISGVVAIIVGFVAVLIGGEPKEAKKGSAAVVKWYADNKDEAELSAIIGVLAVAILIFFFAYLSRILREAEGANGVLSILPLIGATILGTGLAIDSMLQFAAAEAVDNKVDPSAVLAMQAIWDNDWLPFMLGAVIILWSTAISIIRHGALPKWLGWILVVLGVVALTPIGWAALIGLLVWILGVSIFLTIRATRSPQQAAAV